MMTWLGLMIFVTAWVACGVFWEKKRTAVHFIVLFITVIVALITCVTAVTHYREVSFLRSLSGNDLVSVSVGGRARITDHERLQKVVAGLRTPEDFLASRGNHGVEVNLTLGMRGGAQKDFSISRAVTSRGAVVRIQGGGTVLYRDLEWLLPEPVEEKVPP